MNQGVDTRIINEVLSGQYDSFKAYATTAKLDSITLLSNSMLDNYIEYNDLMIFGNTNLDKILHFIPAIKDTSIKKVSLINLDFAPDNLSKIFTILMNEGKNLQELYIEANLSAKDMVALESYLKSSQVATLSINHASLSDEALLLLMSSLQGLNIKTLDLVAMSINDAQLEILLSCLNKTNISLVELKFNKITDVGIAKNLVAIEKASAKINFFGNSNISPQKLDHLKNLMDSKNQAQENVEDNTLVQIELGNVLTAYFNSLKSYNAPSEDKKDFNKKPGFK